MALLSRSLYRRGPGRRPRPARIPYIVVRDALRARRPTSSKDVAYLGWHGNGNAGDDAIFGLFDRHMQQAGLHTIGAPRAISLKLAGAITRPTNLAGAVVGGGTLIGVPEHREVAQTLLDGADRALTTFGTGVESPAFYGADAHLMERELDRWAELLKRFEEVSVRGPISSELLRARGVDATVVGDPALLVEGSGNKSVHDPELVGLNVGVNWGSWERDPATVLDRMTVVGRRLQRGGRRLRFFVLWPGDKAFMQELQTRIGGISEVVSYRDDLDTLLDAIDGCDVLVAQKLHACVFASALGVPSVMLEYHPKCRDFQMAIGREEYTFRLDRVVPEEILDSVDRISSDRARHVTELKRAVEPLRIRLRDTLERTARLFSTP